MNIRRKLIPRGYRWFALLLFVMGFSLVSHSQIYSPVCPSKDINEILKAPDVQAAIKQAIRNSNVGQHNEQEVGANIIQKYRTTNGTPEYFYDVTLVHGGVGAVTLPKIDERKGRTSRLVATFHTHPGPKGHWTRTLSDGTEIDNIGLHENDKPSPEDVAGAGKRGVPAFIVSDFIVPDPETSHIEIYNNPPAKPRTMSWECPQPSPPGGTSDSISMEADCGDSANDVIKIKNAKAERRIFRAKSDSDWLEIVTTEPNKTIAIPGGQEGRFNLTGNCRDCCGGPSENLAKVSIHEVYSDGSESLPIDTDVTLACKPNPKDCGSTKGDPHLCSHDGLRYDFHGVGEFVLTKTEGLEVQVRYSAAPNSRFASINAAIAAKIGTTRIGLYAGDPVRLTIDGRPVGETLADGEFIWLEGGVTIEKDGEFYRFKGDGYLIEATARPERLGEVFVRVPSTPSSVGLLGNRDGNRKNDIVGSDGTHFGGPLLFDDLYAKFGNSWRVKQADSLFDYGPGESIETFTDLLFPSRRTSIVDIGAADRKAAEAICRKAGVIEVADLQDCAYDIAVTGDEGFANDAKEGREDTESLEVLPVKPTTATTADGVKIEVPDEAIASYPVEIRLSGPVAPLVLKFVEVGSPGNSRPANSYSSSQLKPGAQTITLHAPHKPGSYELRYVTLEARPRVLLSIPFRSVAPVAEILADEVSAAGGQLRVTLTGDVSPNATLTIAPAGSPDRIVGRSLDLQGGLRQSGIITGLPRRSGKYEIRYRSFPSGVIYARKEIEIK